MIFLNITQSPLEAWSGWEEIILGLEERSMPSRDISSIMKVLVKYLRIIKTVICTSILAFLIMLVLFQVSLEFIKGLVKHIKLQASSFLCASHNFQKSMPNSTGAIVKVFYLWPIKGIAKMIMTFKSALQIALTQFYLWSTYFEKLIQVCIKYHCIGVHIVNFTMAFEDDH